MRLRWSVPAVGAAAGALALSGPAAGVVPVPGAEKAVPQVSTLEPLPQLSSAQAPPVEAPRLEQVEQLPQLPQAPRGAQQSVESVQVIQQTAAVGPAGRSGAVDPVGTSSGAAAGSTGASSARDHAAADRRRVAARERRLRQLVEDHSGCLAGLPALERRVLVLRAGIGRTPALSRGRAAQRLELSRSRLVRVERAGLRNLRAAAGGGSCSGHGSVQGGDAETEPVLLAAGGGPPVVGAVAVEGEQEHGSGGARRESGRTVAASVPPAVGPAAEEPAYRLWLLACIGILTLAALAITGWRRLPAAPPISRREQPLRCTYCDGKRHAVNPTWGVYRCLDCGTQDRLPLVTEPSARRRSQRDARTTSDQIGGTVS